MNYRLTCSSAILCSFLASGCSTYTSNKTMKVADSAVAYTEHVNDLLTKTKDHVIDMDSKSLISSRSIDSREENEKKLKENNEVLVKWIDVAEQLREQNKLLLSYFQQLQALMDSPGKNDMSEQLSNISLSISQANQLQAEYGQSKELSRSEADGLGELGQMLVSNHYAARVRRVLLRDRDIIDQQIALQEQQFKEISSIYKRRIRIVNRNDFINKVHGPYVNVTKNEFYAEAWISDRRQWLDREQTLVAFDEIEKANKAFREDWRNLLQGKKDVGAVLAVLGDTNKAINNVYHIYDSRKNPPRTVTNISVVPQ